MTVSEVMKPGELDDENAVAWKARAEEAVGHGEEEMSLLIPPVTRTLEQVSVGLPFPAAATTGYGVQPAAEVAYAAFTPAHDY